MRVIGYIRVSSKGQMDGDGPQRQEDAIRKFSKTHGLSIYKFSVEEGVSGTVEAMNRAAFATMIECIETWSKTPTPIEAVVVERLDRLARDLMVSEFLLTELRKRGIKVFSTDQGLVDVANADGDPTRKLIRQILAAFAEFEKSQLVLKLRLSRERKRRETGRCEGMRPYSHTPQGRIILDLIKQWQRRGFSMTEIVDYLNKGEMKTRAGKAWTKSNLQSFLANNK